jgi:hypothetical protein
MDHLSSKVEQQQPKQQHITWRRERVAELSAQGRTEREIATMLRVGAATVGRDLAYLNKQARESLQVHIQKRLPDQYSKYLNGLSQVLKLAWNIVLIDSGNNTTKLQALSLISDCYRYQMDLSTNGVVITDAIKYINGKMDHLNNQEKKLLQSIKEEAEAEAEAEDNERSGNSERELELQQTHNEIF